MYCGSGRRSRYRQNWRRGGTGYPLHRSSGLPDAWADLLMHQMQVCKCWSICRNRFAITNVQGADPKDQFAALLTHIYPPLRRSAIWNLDKELFMASHQVGLWGACAVSLVVFQGTAFA